MSAAVDMFRINNNNSNEVAKSISSSKDPMSITPDDAIFSMSFDAAATDSESGIQMTAAAQKLKTKRRKKKRLCESMSMARFKDMYYLCSGHPNIIQLVEYFEEEDYFYLVFEKANGGPLLGQIQRRVRFSEAEAAKIVRDLASA